MKVMNGVAAQTAPVRFKDRPQNTEGLGRTAGEVVKPLSDDFDRSAVIRPVLRAPLSAIQAGDWRGAGISLDRARHSHPGIAHQLPPHILHTLPPTTPANVNQQLGQLLPSLQKALSTVVDYLAVKQALADGDFGKLGDALAKLSNDDPQLGQQVSLQVLGALIGALTQQGSTSGGLDGVPQGGPNLSPAPSTPLSQVFANTPSYAAGMKGAPGIGLASQSTAQVLAEQAKQMEALGQKTVAQGQVGFNGSLFSARGEWGNPNGNFYAQGSLALGQGVLQAAGGVTADLDNLSFGAYGNFQAGLYAVNAQGSVQARTPLGLTQAAGEAMVGAEAVGQGNVVVDPLHGNIEAELEGDAFAGARAGIDFQQTLGPVGLGGSAKAEVGIGVNFGADVGFQDGTLHAKFDIGAALGIGVDFKFNVNINFKELANDLIQFITDPTKFASALMGGIGDAVGWLGHAAGDVVGTVGHAIGDAASAVGNAVGDAAHAVGSVANAVGDFFSGW